jgi:deazaflavin-dependent oxidoreductase (nitroreductase family)
MSTSAEDYNAKLIVEFRANDGCVGGVWEGTPLLLLHHTGAKSGVSRVNPVGYLPDAPRYLIFASNGGATSNPDWYHNLKAQPSTRVEVGRETIDVLAEEATGEERERLFARGADRFPDLAKYARRADRVIPVIVLTPLRGARATVDTADERSLLAQARAGDENAFGRLASHHRPGLERYCQLMLGCPHHAHEAVCESLLRGWRELDRVAPSASPRIWLYRLATDVCLEDLGGTDESHRRQSLDERNLGRSARSP